MLALFQSHWLDDLGSGESDAAGIAVSALGSAAVLVGFLGYRVLIGRILLRLGLVVVALVSVADLIGMRPDGSLAPDLIEHWTSGLGMVLVGVVVATLLCAIGLLAGELRRVKSPG